MRFNNIEDDDKENLFDGFNPEEEVKKPKEPRYRPEDPRYWDKDEGEWDHLRVHRKTYKLLMTAAALLVIILLWLCWRMILSPYGEDTVQYGYIETIEKRGDVFKTYEGVMLPYKELHDTTRIYREDFTFSTSDKIGPVLREFQNSGRPLRVEYRTYRFPLPWNGENKRVVIRVDTVNPATIIPATWLRSAPVQQ